MNLVFISLTAFASSALGVLFANLIGQVIARRRWKKSFKRVQARLDALFADTCTDCQDQGYCDCDE